MAIPLNFAISVALAGFMAVAASCSPGKENSANEGGTGGTDTDPMATLVAALCDGLGECCSTRQHAFDRAACEAAATTEMERRQPTGGAPVWHPEVVGECADVLRTSLSVCDGIPFESICDNVYSGTAPTGSPCSFASDCAPVSGTLVSCLDKTCAVERRVTLGGTCNAPCSEKSCPDYSREVADAGHQILRCDEDAGLACVNGVCVLLPADGEPCLGGSPLCAPGHHCVAGDLLCVADAALGEDCSDRACAEGSWCSDSTCVAPLQTGEPCYKAEQCQSGICDFDETETEKYCLPASEGEWDAAACAGDVSF